MTRKTLFERMRDLSGTQPSEGHVMYLLDNPSQPPAPGDWVVIDRQSGKLRKAVAGKDRKAFPVPPTAAVKGEGIEWPIKP